MKKVILTLVLGVTAAASAQTSTNGSNWLDVACPNKEPEKAWRQCVMQALDERVAAENKHLAEIQARQDALYEAEAKKLHKHPTVRIQVVDTDASARQYNYYIPGTSGHSTTNCNGSATATTNGTITTANGIETCDTTSTPGRPAMIGTGSIAQSNVHAIMADGTHVTLWCQAGFRRCANLSPGTYSAEVDGNSLWMFTYELGGKDTRSSTTGPAPGEHLGCAVQAHPTSSNPLAQKYAKDTHPPQPASGMEEN